MYVPAGSVKVPVPVKGDVPPDAVTAIVELPPLHKIAVAVAFTVNKVGSVIIIESVSVHPFRSETVTIYVPAVILTRFWEVTPFDHKKFNGLIPPLTDIITEPFE